MFALWSFAVYALWMAKLGVVLDDMLLRRFRVAALKEGKTVSEVVREFVAWYVAEKEKT